jgi:cell division protein FtsZ
MTLEDINRAGEMVLESVSKDARVVWGSKINPNLEGKIRATVVLAGVDSPFLMRQDKGAVMVSQSKPKVIKIKSQKAVE